VQIKALYASTSLVLQKGSYTCGPTAILNVLKAKDSSTKESERSLARRCGSTVKDGTSHEGMTKGAQAVGLKIVEEKRNASILDVERNLRSGRYVIVNYFNAFTGFGHYAVITESDNDAFYLFDSFYGLFRMEKKVFTSWWRSRDGIPRWLLAVR
jgi:predicted double-glycine peptidase